MKGIIAAITAVNEDVAAEFLDGNVVGKIPAVAHGGGAAGAGTIGASQYEIQPAAGDHQIHSVDLDLAGEGAQVWDFEVGGFAFIVAHIADGVLGVFLLKRYGGGRRQGGGCQQGLAAGGCPNQRPGIGITGLFPADRAVQFEIIGTGDVGGKGDLHQRGAEDDDIG